MDQDTAYSKNILLCFTVIIACFVLAEIFLRTFYPQRTFENFQSMDAPIFLPSDILPWELKKNAEGRQISPYDEFNVFVQTNSLGTRGAEPLDKKENVKRILFLGDSFTYGQGVSDSDSYPRQLESLLNKRTFLNINFDVVNAAYADGYSPDAYYVYLAENIEKIKPDLVVMGFYVGNDVDDLCETKWTGIDAKGLPKRIQTIRYIIDENGRRRLASIGIFRGKILYRINLFLYSYFHSYVFIKNNLINILNSYASLKEGPYYSDHWNKRLESNWKKIEKIMAEIKQELAGRNIPLVVVIINSRVQTVDTIWVQYKKKFSTYVLDRLNPNKKVLSLCRKNNIYCLDLYDAFAGQDKQDDYYFAIDGHWNEKGHQLAAEAIYDFLIQNGLHKK